MTIPQLRHRYHTRRTTIVLAGGTLLSGCTTLPNSDPPEHLPILLGLQVENETGRKHDYRLRVKYSAKLDTTPERFIRQTGTLQARGRREIGGDWPNEPGRYVVEISVDGQDWHTNDITERLIEMDEERVCYRHDVAITDADSVSFRTNLWAECPE